MARAADGRGPASGRRFVVPARIKITGWVLLLTAVVLATVTIVTRDLLLVRVDDAVAAGLEQEAAEFSRVAAGGVDPATQRPFTDVREVLYAQLQRQYPDADEFLVGWVDGGDSGGGGEVLRQQRAERFPLASRHDVLDPIVASTATAGSVGTDAGELRWVKVPVLGPPAQPDGRGAFVIGVLMDGKRAEVAATIGTLIAVGLIGLAVAGIVAWVVAGQILAPVRAVRRTAAQITEQDLTRRIPVGGRDDVAALAEQFNAMLDRLELAFTTQRQFAVLERLRAAGAGDVGPINELLDWLSGPDGTPPELFSAGLHLATLCADVRSMPWGDSSAPSNGRDRAVRRAVAHVPASATWPFPKQVAGEQGIVANCRHWPPSRPIPRTPFKRIVAPTLLLGGDRDLSTPIEWAEAQQSAMPNAKLVVVPGAGHSVQRRSADGAREAVTFLLGS